MKLKEALKNHMGEKVKIGSSASFVFCGEVDENIFETMKQCSEYEIEKRMKAYTLQTRKSHKAFMSKLADKMNAGLRRIKRQAAFESWELDRYNKEIAAFMNECESEKEHEREMRMNNVASEEFKKNWVEFLERNVKEEYESLEGGTIIIIEGNETGAYWTYEEYERRCKL